MIDEVGELVITEPMPSMPVGFWNDADGSRLREAYYETYPGVWRHGDWVKFAADGSCVIYGRSDSTLNRGGVRMGTSEFYRVVEDAARGRRTRSSSTPRRPASRASCCCSSSSREGASLDDVTAAMRGRTRSQLSPRHVPDEVIAVDVGTADDQRQEVRGAGQAGAGRRAAGQGGGAGRARRPDVDGAVRRARRSS